MTDIEQLEELYKQYTNNESSFDFLNLFHTAKSNITNLICIYDTNNCVILNTIWEFFRFIQASNENYHDKMTQCGEFFSHYEKLHSATGYNDFFRLAAKIFVDNFVENKITAENKKPTLTQCKEEHTAFVDLFTGYNFYHFHKDLKPETHYYLVDWSPMACEVNKKRLENDCISNVDVLCKDVKTLKKGDFSEEIEILRVKNGFRYLHDLDNHIPHFQTFIRSHGTFLFEESSSQRETYKELYKNRVIPLFPPDEWEYSFKEGDPQNELSLDAYVFSKRT